MGNEQDRQEANKPMRCLAVQVGTTLFCSVLFCSVLFCSVIVILQSPDDDGLLCMCDDCARGRRSCHSPSRRTSFLTHLARSIPRIVCIYDLVFGARVCMVHVVHAFRQECSSACSMFECVRAFEQPLSRLLLDEWEIGAWKHDTHYSTANITFLLFNDMMISWDH